ncbi:hypothetical protein AMS68_000228 [Peltaster fructicola]|uniref:Uncharacterized protein n=1 Tax=Peltaster fructicola TaxID=286661 RepID=A0A6H0XJ96_9PEZI|nr:hypothetical protein AMS68_000228 [Peltaster fructicola]
MSTTLASSVTTTAQSTTSQSFPTTRDNLPAWPSAVPTGSPDPSASSDASSSQNAGPVSYYFVFFALVFCIVAFAILMYWRRRRMLMRRGSRPHLLATREAAAPTQRVPRHLGPVGSLELSQEEGLNEHGEAPPPYVSKAYEEPGQEHNNDVEHPDSAVTSAIPLQTLSRHVDALQPPHYTQPGENDRSETRSHVQR